MGAFGAAAAQDLRSGQSIMMRLGSLLGLPAITFPAGRRLGRVRDVCIAGPAARVTGILVQPQTWGRPRTVVNWNCVHRAGHDAILLTEPLVPAAGTLLSAMLGWSVFNPDGTELGLLADLWLDPETGALSGLQLTRGLVDDLLAGQPVLPLIAPLHVGEGAVIWDGGGD